MSATTLPEEEPVAETGLEKSTEKQKESSALQKDIGVKNETVTDNAVVEKPSETLEVEEPANESEDNVTYPTGPKAWLTLLSLCVAMFLNGLDLTIVAVAVPRLTDQFHTLSDLGWYSAAYGLTCSAFVFSFGKAYTVFATKSVFLLGLTIFEIGSIICTTAQSSKAFIVGRAVAGLGASAYSGGSLKILKDLFPLSKQAFMVGIMGASQCLGLVSAPVVGGALIDRFGWRACFGINLPLGVLCIIFTFFAFSSAGSPPDATLSIKDKLRRMDLFSTVLIVPAIISLLMALQWGGVKYSWSDARIIVLFVLFGVLFSAFAFFQYYRGDKATVPPRIMKKRTIIGAMWFNACCNGILAMTEYYMSIYYQGVRGYTPTKAGLLALPMLIGMTVTSLLGAAGTSMIGYYTPFLFATSILAPIASGLLTTIDLDGSIVKAAALLGFVGAAVGCGIQGPLVAIQATLSSEDVSIGAAISMFGGGLGSALWICVSVALFQNRLTEEMKKYSPGTDAKTLETVGLSDIRNFIGSYNLHNVLLGYNEAVVQTLYLPVGLGVLTLAGTLAMEMKNIKKKKS